jgi:hypothetical protein
VFFIELQRQQFFVVFGFLLPLLLQPVIALSGGSAEDWLDKKLWQSQWQQRKSGCPLVLLDTEAIRASYEARGERLCPPS